MFQKAVKRNAKLRLSIQGPSGSGKTYTALSIATNLNAGKVAVVDTEHGSASKYADLFDFDVMELKAPYHPDNYVNAIAEAAKAGYGVVVLDSLTHAWKGEGGILELVTEIAKRKYGGNSYAAWNDATPIQKRLIESIVGSSIHVIATMRSKMEYVQEKDERGKSSIRKVGMAPEQRDDMPYEFDVVLDMNTDNEAIVSKTRCPELTGKLIAKPGKQVAETLAKWLIGDGSEQRQPQPPVIAPTLPTPQAEKKEEKQSVEPYPVAWKTPADAQAWAVSNKHCSNEFEAKASFKNSLKEVTGQDKSLDSNHLAAVLENFYKKHMARQNEQQLKAA